MNKSKSVNRKIIQFILLIIFLNTGSVNLFGADCEVIRFVSNYEVRNNKFSETDTIELKIENRSGDIYSNISIPYSKNVKLSDIDGWIKDGNGIKIRHLNSNDITDRNEISGFSLYEDNFVRTFQLKHNQYPYTICYTYKITLNQFVALPVWSPVIHSAISTIDAKLVVTLPKGYRYKSFLKDVVLTDSDTLRNFVKTIYSAKYSRINGFDFFSVPFGDLKPKLIIVPEYFTYGIEGKTSDWKSFGNWYYNLNKGLNDLPESEQKNLSQMLNGITEKTEIIKVLYHYLQDHTRYINISIGIGGLKSYPASYVSQNKYGDCKALTNYMKALLEFAGIKSYFVLINRSFQPEKILTDLPFPQFNHVILAVPDKKDTIWIENTENSEAFNYLSSSIQNRTALFIDENDSRLIQMPGMQRNDVTMQRKINIVFNELENAEAKISFSFNGYNYELFNELLSGFNKNEQDKFIKEYIPFNNYDLLSWKLNKENRDTARIDLDLNLSLPKVIKNLGDDYYFNTFSIKTGFFSPPSQRELPLQFPCPVFNVDSQIYQIPTGLEVKSMPADQIINTSFGNYEAHFKWDSNNIIVGKKFELHPNTYSQGQYKDFYEFYRKVKDAEKKVIILKRKI